MADQPFDDNGRLLAYVAPSFSRAELGLAAARERATFNLDLIEGGWAAPFVIYPVDPGRARLSLCSSRPRPAPSSSGRAFWADPLSLLAYEYRAVEKLHGITARLVGGADLSPADRFGWRSRYCADIRSRRLHGPEDYVEIPPPYRLWLWPRRRPGSGEQAQPSAGTAAGRRRAEASLRPAGIEAMVQLDGRTV